MKKIFKILLTVSLIFCFAIGLVACGDGYTKGLEYTLYYADENGEGGRYGVSGIGTATDKDIVIPVTYKNSPVSWIENHVFTSNTSITSLTVSDRESFSIADNAFSGCTSLRKVSIGNGCMNISNRAFADCSSLVKVKIDSSRLNEGLGILKYAFANCVSLEEIIITQCGIWENAFENCPNLKKLYFHGDQDDWEFMNKGDRDSLFYSRPLHPEGNEDLLNAKIYFYSETQPEDTENSYWHYVDGEAVVW